MRWSKKGALELSINAIVVLILAITILGLGIAFIRGQFGALQKQFVSVSSEVETELLNKIKESGKLLVFSQAKIEVQTGKKESVYFGIQNPESKPVCYSTVVRCLNALNPDTENECTTGVTQGSAVGGFADITSTQAKWINVLTPVTIKQGATGVYPMNIQIPSTARKDTYLLEVEVFKAGGSEEDGGKCPTDKLPAEMTSEQSGDTWASYATEQFFLTVN